MASLFFFLYTLFMSIHTSTFILFYSGLLIIYKAIHEYLDSCVGSVLQTIYNEIDYQVKAPNWSFNLNVFTLIFKWLV